MVHLVSYGTARGSERAREADNMTPQRGWGSRDVREPRTRMSALLRSNSLRLSRKRRQQDRDRVYGITTYYVGVRIIV
jgi:hypothetical protein